jgi:peptide/nickel transport system permease protein
MRRALLAYARNPAAILGALLVLAVLGMGLAAPLLFPNDPLGLAGRPLQWPGANPRFPLGTDPSGRDIMAQLFHGARVSLLIGFVATLLATAIGIAIGALAGFYGGWVDTVLMRVTEAFQTLPNFLLLLVLVAVFGSHINTVTIAIGLVSWPPVARLTRAEFLTLRTREFVQAARVQGLSDLHLMLREVLPVAILLESALAFLQLSDPNVPSWGNLIGLGRNVLRVEWYVSAIPGVAILLTILGVSLVGQGLNDALNPRITGR